MSALTVKGNKIQALIFFLVSTFSLAAQRILDPCFLSPNLGQYSSTAEISQVCKCSEKNLSSDLIQWNGTIWEGALEDSRVLLPPPPGCNQRAIWIGYSFWTPGGEAFALKLDRAFIAGQSYSYSFTYAQTGVGREEPFSPIIYTNSQPDFPAAKRAGRLPATTLWNTASISFTADVSQAVHTWLIIHAVESSGIILANCDVKTQTTSTFLPADTVICQGRELTLEAPSSRFYKYRWNTGEQDPELVVRSTGLYALEISMPSTCSAARDEIFVEFVDCTVQLEIPTVFTPNNDRWNSVFTAKSANYVKNAQLRIFNRWGELVFEGDLFQGWDGQTTTADEATTGTYYWECYYNDLDNNPYYQKGFLQLVR